MFSALRAAATRVLQRRAQGQAQSAKSEENDIKQVQKKAMGIALGCANAFGCATLLAPVIAFLGTFGGLLALGIVVIGGAIAFANDVANGLAAYGPAFDNGATIIEMVVTCGTRDQDDIDIATRSQLAAKIEAIKQRLADGEVTKLRNGTPLSNFDQNRLENLTSQYEALNAKLLLRDQCYNDIACRRENFTCKPDLYQSN